MKEGFKVFLLEPEAVKGKLGKSSSFDFAGLGLGLEDGSGVAFLGLDCIGAGITGLAPNEYHIRVNSNYQNRLPGKLGKSSTLLAAEPLLVDQDCGACDAPDVAGTRARAGAPDRLGKSATMSGTCSGATLARTGPSSWS